MATVPEIAEPVAPTSPKPEYQPDAVGLAAFGGAQAAALKGAAPQLENASNALSDAAVRQQAVNSAVSRGNALQAFINGPAPGTQPEDGVTNDPQSSLAHADLTDGPGGVAATSYRGSLDQQIQALVAAENQKNGPNSAAMLNDTLQAKRGEYVTAANSLAQQTATKSVMTAMGTELGPILNEASSGMGNLGDQMTRGTAVVARYADALPGGPTGPAAVSAHNAVTQKILENTAHGLFDRAGGSDSYDEIQNFLAQNKGLMNNELYGESQAKLTAARAELARLGARPGGINDPNSPTNFVLSNAASFGVGHLPPVQDGQFQMAVQTLAKPTTRQNPQNGTWETIPGIDLRTIPAIVQAYSQRNLPLPGGTPPGSPEAPQTFNPQTMQWESAPPDTAPASPVATPGSPQANVAASPSLGAVLAPGPAQAAPAPVPGSTFMGQPTLWSIKNKVGGAANTIERGMNAVIPGGVAPGDASVQAKQRVSIAGQALISALSDANLAGGLRATPGETKELQGNLDELNASFLSTQQNFAAKATGIDDSLAVRQGILTARANDPQEDVKVRQQARQLVAQIQGFRNTLGVPPKVTLQQAQSLAADPKNAGMLIRAPSGAIRTIRYVATKGGAQ